MKPRCFRGDLQGICTHCMDLLHKNVCEMASDNERVALEGARL